MREWDEEKLKRLDKWPFVVNTSWKVMFGCGTALLIMIESSGIHDLLFKPTGRMKTIENMYWVLLPSLLSAVGLRYLRQIARLKNLENSTLLAPRFVIVTLLFFAYMFLLEDVGTLADWFK